MSHSPFPDTAWAEIDLAALRHNAGIVRQLAPRSKIMAMLKADAYGHGLIDCAQALADLVDGLAVARLDEAAQLRARYPHKPLLLTAAHYDLNALAWCAEQRVAIVLHEPVVLGLLRQLSHWPPVWLKFNTGMNRLGFDAETGLAVLAELQRRQVELVAMSHFACADEPDEAPVRAQMQQFDALLAEHPGVVQSLANSAAIMAYAAAHRDWVRPGLMLYGADPMQQPSGLDLRPVMRLKARVLAVNAVPAQACVGYGAQWQAARASRIATVGIGYGDGYPRLTRPGAEAVIRAQRVPLVGRVSMDMLALDVTELPVIQTGEAVELWGECLPVAELAQQSGRLAYDLLCQVQGRVPRRIQSRLD